MYDEKCLTCIGSNIRFLRMACQISQQELAQHIGISQTHLSNLERNRVQISLKLLLRIANMLDCPLENFLSVRSASAWVEQRRTAADLIPKACTPEEVRQLLELLRQ